MVERTFSAYASSSLTIDSSSPSGTAGSAIINNSGTPNGTIFVFNGGGRSQITLNDTGGNQNTFNDGQPNSHTIVDGGGIVANGNGVESESRIFLRALDDDGDPTGPTIQISVFSQNGETSNVWGFSANEFLDVGTTYVKVSGSNNGSSSYENFVACFVAGTRIRTDAGPRKIEDLRIGDLVWTQSNGFQPVRWISDRWVDGTGASAPIRFDTGVMQNEVPVLVSPLHRMVLQGLNVELLSGEPSAFATAKSLLDLPGVTRARRKRVRYLHLLFDNHEVIDARGCLSESFFPSDVSLCGLDWVQREEFLTLHRPLAARSSTATLALPCLTRTEALVLSQ